MPARAALATMGIGAHAQYLDIVLPTFEAFAARHGYTVVERREKLDPLRPSAWSKIRLLQETLGEFDEVLWIDCDAIIVDFGEDLRSEIPADAEWAWCVNREDSTGILTPNTGVLLLRRSPSVLQALEAAYSNEDLIDHYWWDQAGLIRALGMEHPAVPTISPRTSIAVSQCILDPKWNAMRDSPAVHPHIRHFAGESALARQLLISELFLTQVQHLLDQDSPTVMRARETAQSLRQSASLTMLRETRSRMASIRDQAIAQLPKPAQARAYRGLRSLRNAVRKPRS